MNKLPLLRSTAEVKAGLFDLQGAPLVPLSDGLGMCGHGLATPLDHMALTWSDVDVRTVHGSVAGKMSLSRAEPLRARQETVTRITRFLEARGSSHLHLAELCGAAGVSERTLRSIFHEVFGIGPGRYLRMRRLELIRVALAMADPAQDTVAAIATRYGFSDGGRMARDYLVLFGEYPSATLARRITNDRG